LRLGDVDYAQGILTVRGDAKERRMTLSVQGWHSLFSYLEQHRPKETCLVRGQARGQERGQAEGAYLFLSERDRPLTPNAITLLFCRLKTRAGITKKRVRPSVLRDTFAVEYLQSGGKPETLCEILGLADVAAVKRYQRLIDRLIENETQKEPAEEYLSRQMLDPQKSRRRRRRLSATAIKKRMQQDAGNPHCSAG